MTRFHDLVATHAGGPGEVIVGIETDRGLWVQALVEAGYVVYAINPTAASRYRDRHTLSGAKSDPGDVKMLAELVRTDRHDHREVAGDTAVAEGVKVIARVHQTLIWERTRATNRLRCSLREYFPAALDTFDELAERDTLAVLATAATPTEAAKLTPAKIRTVLRQAGRQRNIDTRADTIAAGLRTDALRPAEVVEAAHGATTRASVAIITALNTQINALADELAEHFEQHPDSDIYLSLPGVGVVLGARALGEFGDDPTAMPTPSLARTTPERQPSPEPQARNRSGSPGSLATTVSLTRSISGRSPPSPPAPAPACSTTDAAQRATHTTKPSAPSPTDGSASCTAASTTGPATTRTPPGRTASTATSTRSPKPWDVCAASVEAVTLHCAGSVRSRTVLGAVIPSALGPASERDRRQSCGSAWAHPNA